MKNWAVRGFVADMTDRHLEYQAALLEAGEIEFNLHGFTAAKNYAIAARAQVSPSTLHRFFPGKTALWNAIHEERGTEIEAALYSSSCSADPTERILEAVRDIAYYLAINPTYLDLQISSGVSWATADPSSVSRGHSQQSSWQVGRDRLIRGIHEASGSGRLVPLRPELIAGIIISTLQVWLCDWVSRGRLEPPAEMADGIAAHLHRLIAGPPG